MSGFALDHRRIEANWNALPAMYRNGMVTIDVQQSNNDLFYDFQVECNGKASKAHLNLKSGATYYNGTATAHVTLINWPEQRKTNYWYTIDKGSAITDPNLTGKMKSNVEGTSKVVSNLPSEVKVAICDLIRRTYNGCL